MTILTPIRQRPGTALLQDPRGLILPNVFRSVVSFYPYLFFDTQTGTAADASLLIQNTGLAALFDGQASPPLRENDWLNADLQGVGAGTPYSVKGSMVSGDLVTGNGLDTWFGLASNIGWNLARGTPGTSEAIFNIQFRRNTDLASLVNVNVRFRATWL